MDTIEFVDLVAHNRLLEHDFVAAMKRVLAHGQFILGPEVAEFEAKVTEKLGASGVVSCNSGTDALVLALRLRRIGPGDEVLTVSHSFVATANAIRLVGATPVFIDIDDETMLMDPESLEANISERSRAVIPVHLNGYPADIPRISKICERNDLALIEDCSQAFGATRDGRHVGTTQLGCFSMHPLKALSALGDAGFLSVHDTSDIDMLRVLRQHGLVDRNTCAVSSINSRLDSLQAGFLLIKLQHIDAWIQRRREHAKAYHAALSEVLRLPALQSGCDPMYSTFVVRHPRRDQLRDALMQQGIGTKVHYPTAIHQQPAYRDQPVQLPVTERVVNEIISLPISPELQVSQRNRVIESVLTACRDLNG